MSKLSERQRQEIRDMNVKRGEAKRIAPRFGISASWFRKLNATAPTSCEAGARRKTPPPKPA
jgi:hypothetical protein